MEIIIAIIITTIVLFGTIGGTWYLTPEQLAEVQSILGDIK